jgi:hypothetical protein
VSGKNADAATPRADIFPTNDSCTAGEFPGTPDEGNAGELLPRILPREQRGQHETLKPFGDDPVGASHFVQNLASRTGA